MDFEPQKLYIGVTDFFAILLPGALLTYIFTAAGLGELLLGDLRGPQAWIAFFFASYLIGHFIFLLGSWLLDDRVYDKIRMATYLQQVRRLANGGTASSPTATWLAAHCIKNVSDHALTQAVRIKDLYLDPLDASPAINAFQWCKARLSLEHPEALAIVEHFEADSKFFRSLLIVLGVLVPGGLVLVLWRLAAPSARFDIGRAVTATVVSLFLFPLAFWRYVDQRVKATNQAYWDILTLEANSGRPPRPVQPLAAAASHAGGVVFRQVDGQARYLLVQASDAPDKWVLPKGHIKSGERMQEAAVREVQEEAGVWARIKRPLEIVSFSVNDKSIGVQFYLMEAVGEGKPSDKRGHVWLRFEEAVQKATHLETKNLLRQVGA